MKFLGRDYQLEVHEKIMDEFAAGRNPAVDMVTRSGKAWNICRLAELAHQHNKPMMIVVHTNILVKQMLDELTDNSITYGVIKVGYKENRELVQVASRDTLIKRLHKYKEDDFSTIAIDEAHLAKSNGFMSIIKHFHHAKLILFSGTLVRLDGSSFDDICDSIIHGPSKQELIKRGIIIPTYVALPEIVIADGLKKTAGDFTKSSQEKILRERYIHGDYVQNYFEFAPGRKGLIFTPTIDFAREVTENFNKAGIPTVEISSRDSDTVRDQKLKDYYSGKYMLMASVDLFLMGFHLKEGSVSIELRYTASTMVYHQMLARCTMPDPENGKVDHIAIDCANNIWHHSHPDLLPDFKLQGESKSDRAARLSQIALSIVRCDSCRWSYNRDTAPHNNAGNIICPRCGSLLEVSGRQIKTIDGKLTLVTSEQWADYEMQKRWEAEQEYLAEEKEKQQKQELQMEVRSATNREALEAIAKKRGYAQGWVEHKLRGKGIARNRHRVSSMF